MQQRPAASSPVPGALSATTRSPLSIIAEDENAATPPSRLRNLRSPPSTSSPSVSTSNRPYSRRWRDEPPSHSFEQPPPDYDVWDENAPKTRQQLLVEKLRGNKQLTKRGGWRRVLLYLIVLLAILVALAVGLGVGLSTRNSSSNSNSNSNPNSPPASNSGGSPTSSASFPAGTYAIPVFLTDVSTNCTSISPTWACYPYQTYDQNESSSMATFNWIITADNSNSNFTLGTSENPFAPTFSNVPLTLQNPNAPDEHYAFSLNLFKKVVPDATITNDGSNANCYYNNTIFSGVLYTKKPPQTTTLSNGNNTGSMNSNNSDWKPWPYAVNVTQSISGGQNVPNCYEFGNNGADGPRVTNGLEPQPANQICECKWMNFDL
jgi:hypothetical protein